MIVLGENAQTIADGGKVYGGEINGRKKVLTDKYLFTGELAVNDEIDIPDLPAGAKVLDAYIAAPSLGATGIVTLGHRATEDADGNVLAEDPDAFIASADFGGAAALVRAGVAGKEAGIGVRFNGLAKTGLFLTVTEATAAADTNTLEVMVEFVID